ncbi:hypothetical protein BLAHAN_04723 [Blautia hansenii DSM 20583]|uniref:Uncharacterized protein n=1 Tax=Blautia hansenii DSM 20583 TaxID=537007 RepID=C9L5R7_BLAHA|nr:hypothetical protein BLAHAN_04723 [Blautia hansenii DSM 20583]
MVKGPMENKSFFIFASHFLISIFIRFTIITSFLKKIIILFFSFPANVRIRKED